MSTLPDAAAATLSSTPARWIRCAGEVSHCEGPDLQPEDLTSTAKWKATVELQEHRLTVGRNGRVTAEHKAREMSCSAPSTATWRLPTK